MEIKLVRAKRKPKDPCWYDDRIRPNDRKMDRLIKPTRESLVAQLRTLTHPLQFKLYLKRAFEFHNFVNPENNVPLFVYAAQQVLQTSILGAWFEAFKIVFNRSPYPAELYDPRERGSVPWVNWDEVDEIDQQELERLNLIEAVDNITHWAKVGSTAEVPVGSTQDASAERNSGG